MSTLTVAWQAALAAEHQAYYGYSLLGPWLDADRAPLARTQLLAHADLRDATATAMLTAGVRPSDPAASYPLTPVRTNAAATTLAITLEDDCADAWRYLYAVATDRSGKSARSIRRQAQVALSASAVRAAQWRVLDHPDAATQPFPGI